MHRALTAWWEGGGEAKAAVAGAASGAEAGLAAVGAAAGAASLQVWAAGAARAGDGAGAGPPGAAVGWEVAAALAAGGCSRQGRRQTEHVQAGEGSRPGLLVMMNLRNVGKAA